MFVKGKSGNPKGKEKGVKHNKTQQWEELAESITTTQAEYFSRYMANLWTSADPKHHATAAELYLKTLEYFKPKYSRVESSVELTGDGLVPLTIEKASKKIGQKKE